MGSAAPGHVGELRLRRYRTGELPAVESDEVARHTAACPACRARLHALDDEQRQFEREIPFERFAGGVERAHRVPRSLRRPRLFFFSGAVLAAAAALVLVARGAGPLAPAGNRIKGSPTEAVLRVAGPGGGEQRALAPGARLALGAGERVRLGFRTDAPRHLVALSIDEAGAVTPLYPEHEPQALAVAAGRAVSYLPDSLEFTGGGRERVFLLLVDRAVTVEEMVGAARAAHQRAHGDLDALSRLPLGELGNADQFTWLLVKPGGH